MQNINISDEAKAIKQALENDLSNATSGIEAVVAIDYSAKTLKKFLEANKSLSYVDAKPLWEKEMARRQNLNRELFEKANLAESTYKTMGRVDKDGFIKRARIAKGLATAQEIQSERLSNEERSAKKDSALSALYAKAQGYKA